MFALSNGEENILGMGRSLDKSAPTFSREFHFFDPEGEARGFTTVKLPRIFYE